MSTAKIVEKVVSVIDRNVDNLSPSQYGEVLEQLIDELQDRLDDLNGEDEP